MPWEKCTVYTLNERPRMGEKYVPRKGDNRGSCMNIQQRKRRIKGINGRKAKRRNR